MRKFNEKISNFDVVNLHRREVVSLFGFCIVVINSLKKREFLHLDDVVYLEASDNSTNIYLIGDRKITVDICLRECTLRINDCYFRRVCKSFAINVNQVAAFDKTKCAIVFHHNMQIKLPKEQHQAFLELLEELCICM